MPDPRTVVNFKEDCVDPLAKLVLLEAMSFAVEKAESRLASLGKIFPGLESMGGPIIQDIKDIRFAVENLNVCPVRGPAATSGGSVVPPAEPPPSTAIKQFPKHEQELIKAMPPSLQTALMLELARRSGRSIQDPDFWVGGVPISATREQKKKATGETKEVVGETKAAAAETKKRTLPTAWGPLTLKPREGALLQYSSPGAFLSALHGGDIKKIRGMQNYVQQLDVEGYDVFIGGQKIDPLIKKEALEKLKGVGITVQLKKGRTQSPPPGGTTTGAQPAAAAKTQYRQPWVTVKDSTGKFLRFEDYDGKVIPEAVWREFTSVELDTIAPMEKQV